MSRDLSISRQRRWRLTDLFFEVDKTRAGYVHLPALLDFLKRCMSAPPPPGQLRRLYALLDVDGDGTVSYKDLTMRLNRAKAALRVAEAEGTGYVPDTFPGWPFAVQMVQCNHATAQMNHKPAHQTACPTSIQSGPPYYRALY